MIPITYEQAVRALRAAVAGKPAGYVYSGRINGHCVYRTESGEPSCIVADALVRLGVGVQNFPDPTALVQLSASFLLQSLEEGKVLSVDPRTVGLFAHAQVTQDSGRTWAAAVEYAERNS